MLFYDKFILLDSSSIMLRFFDNIFHVLRYFKDMYSDLDSNILLSISGDIAKYYIWTAKQI